MVTRLQLAKSRGISTSDNYVAIAKQAPQLPIVLAERYSVGLKFTLTMRPVTGAA